VAVGLLHGRRDLLGLPRSLTPTLPPGLPKAAGEMHTTILEDAMRFSFLVTIKISYPVPSKSTTLLYDALLFEGRRLTKT
jgi:hypothetical protein